MAGAEVDVSVFTITELTGQKRTVRLVGRALPYRPFELSGIQRLETTWYPGCPEGTNSVFGSALEPSSINGMWKDKYVAAVSGGQRNVLPPATVNGTAVQSVDELVNTMDSIRAEGQEIEVIWFTKIRRGQLSKFTETWLNQHDVQWSADFAWTSNGRALGPAAFRQAATSDDATGLFEKQRDNLVIAIPPPPELPLFTSFTDAISTEVGLISTAVEAATNATATLALQANTPGNAARRVVATANGVVARATAMSETLDSQPARTRVVGEEPATMTLGQMLRAQAYVTGVRGLAQTLKRTGVETASKLGQTIAPDLLATYRPRNGENLRDVSRKFYGTSFQWREILDFNLLDSSILTAGQTILVPRTTGQQR